MVVKNYASICVYAELLVNKLTSGGHGSIASLEN